MRTFRIFLASSFELKPDREQFEIYIYRQNKLLVEKGVFLDLVIWEDFIDAVSRTRLQDEYNKALRESDIFVMLFANKVGKYTEEEFETAFGQFQKASKPLIYTYFKDVPITTATANRHDLASLWKFQERLTALGHFPTIYDSPEALQLHFGAQLAKLGVADSSSIQSHVSKLDRQVTNYLRWLKERTQSIELRGIERAGGAPIVVLPLETAYVPLSAMSSRHVDREAVRMGIMRKLMAEAKDATRFKPDESVVDRLLDKELAEAAKLTAVPLNEVLRLGNRLVVVGRPGSGKTTVLLHMAWALASSLLSAEPEPARTRLGWNTSEDKLPLPIFVPLASYARYRRSLPPHVPVLDRTLAHFITHHLMSKQAEFNLPSDFFVRLLDDGRDVLLLLDGLDEVANEDERAEVRQSVEELVFGRPELRVLVTCRTAAYRTGRTALGRNFREVQVGSLDYEAHIVPMVEQAYACILPQNAAERNERSSDLLRGILRMEGERRSRSKNLSARLVDSPLMVRLLLIVHVSNRTLPEERAALFEKAVDALMQVNYGVEEGVNRELSEDWKLFRDMAQHLAFHMHEQGDAQGREIYESELKKAFSADECYRPRLEDFISHARHRGSVIEERDSAYRFIHLAFQEFLVARYLREVVGADGRADILKLIEPRLADPWWHEPICLLAGYWAEHSAGPARDFVLALANLGSSTTERYWGMHLACTAALSWKGAGPQLLGQLGRRVDGALGDAVGVGEAGLAMVIMLGRDLDAIGDPRFMAQGTRLPIDELSGFVHVAADRAFRIGTRAAVVTNSGRRVPDDEINDTPTPVPEFYIGRYLVTVAQFDEFIARTGRTWHPDPQSAGNMPATNINWFDALEYCAWLQSLLRSEGGADNEIARLLQTGGWQLTLPSELEWEKAARGGAVDHFYPWGNASDRTAANCGPSVCEGPSSVGSFPANGYGLFDMIGNVSEWTRNINCAPYSKTVKSRHFSLDGTLDPGAAPDGARIIRGGAWLHNWDRARCGARVRVSASDADRAIGFRLVLRNLSEAF